MRASTILLTLAVIALAAVAGAVGYFAGAGRASDRVPALIAPSLSIGSGSVSVPDTVAAPVPATSRDPRADLIRALALPAPEGPRAVRLAMNAWLAADGAAAIMAARGDPELHDAADRMTQLALYVYPELVVDHPALLEAMPEQAIAMGVSAIARFNPEEARTIIDAHLSDSPVGDAMLSMVDRVGESQPAGDPKVELESILAERNFMMRIPRVHQLVTRVAADDPLAAAELIEDMPGSLAQQAIHPLMEVWAGTNPEEAARWLADQDAPFSQNGLSVLAWRWAMRDLEAASTFADTLTGRKRTMFLTNLGAAAVQHMSSTADMLAWASRYEDDPAHAGIVMNVAQHLAQEDLDAAVDLIETLPDQERVSSYGSVVSSLAFQDPEAAIDLLDDIGEASVRDEVLPVISSVWGHNDPERALDWALALDPGASRDQSIAAIASSLANFDRDLAMEAIDEIDDPNLRRGSVWPLLVAADSEDEAIRIGREYDFGREAVIEARNGMRGSGFGHLSPRSFMAYPGRIEISSSSDAEQ